MMDAKEMGKKTKYPSFSGGSVSVNGENRASTYKKGNTVYSNYNMPEVEKGIFDYAQNSLLTSLPKINEFSPEVRSDINSQLEAYKNRGLQSINDIYAPILNNAKNDIASRFGNLNNSMFFDKLNSIENNRANALVSLAESLQAQRSNLYNNELSNRYNYLNFMNGLQNQINNNALNYMGLAANNSSAGNSYNQAKYNADVAANNRLNGQYMQNAQMAMQLLPLLL